MNSEEIFLKILGLIGLAVVGACFFAECILAPRRGYTVLWPWMKSEASDIRPAFYSFLVLYFILGLACLAGVTYGIVYLVQHH